MNKPVQEETVDRGSGSDLFHAAPQTQKLRNGVDAVVSAGLDIVQQFLRRHIVELPAVQVPQSDFQRTDGFQQTFFEAPADAHDLAGRLHLRAQRIVGVRKLVEGEARHFRHHIIQCRLKRGGSVGEPDFFERHPDADFGGNAGNRISARFRRESRGAGNARVDFNEVILERVRVERKLDVAAALDFQRADDLQRAVAQHMVFAVGQRLRGADDDGVAGMNAHRVQIFHVADGNGRIVGVAHNLVFDLFVALDALFNQYLMHRGQFECVFQHRAAVIFVLREAAACAAQCECRSQHDRVADLLRDPQSVLDRVRDVGGKDRLTERFAELLEQLAILCTLNAAAFRSQQLGAALGKHAFLFKLHRQIQPGLATDAGQDGVRPLIANDFGDIFERQRLHIHLVGN